MNTIQRSLMLAEKERDGSPVHKRYHPPATPCHWLLADPRMSEEVRRRIEAVRADLALIQLLAKIRIAQRGLMAIADDTIAPIPVADFLMGLRTA